MERWARVEVPDCGPRWRELQLAWLVPDGAEVAAGALLANLCGEGRCGLFELRAPRGGRLRRWSDAVPSARVGDAVAVIDAGAGAALEAVAACRALEAERLSAAVAEAEASRAALAAKLAVAAGLSGTLLSGELSAVDGWLRQARARLKGLGRAGGPSAAW